MYTIELKITNLVKNPETKTTYIVESEEVKTVTKEEHENATNKETVSLFRRLGGAETITKSYTCAGYVVTKIVSTSPDKNLKTVREYSFKTI